MVCGAKVEVMASLRDIMSRSKAERPPQPNACDKFASVNEVDGRGVAIGIVLGTVLGYFIFSVTENTIWIYLGAGLGIIIALGLKKRNGGDGDGTE